MTYDLGALAFTVRADRDELRRDLDGAKADARSFVAETNRLVADVASISDGLARDSGALRSARGRFVTQGREIGQDAGRVAGTEFARRFAEEAQDGSRATGESMGRAIMAGLKTTAVAGGAAGIAGLIAAGGREVTGDRLAAQVGARGGRADALAASATSLYNDAYGEDLAATSEAIRQVVQQFDGYRNAGTAAIEAVAVKVLDLNAAFEEEPRAISAAASQMVRTGLAKDASEALDVLTVGFQTGADQSQDLLDTVTEYSTKFRDLGLTGQQAMGLISQAMRGGARDSDTAADALKEFSILSLEALETTDSKGQVQRTALGDAMQFALGYDADIFAAQQAIAEGGAPAAEVLSQVLDGLREIEDPVARNAAAVALFGTKAEDLGDSLYDMDLGSLPPEFDRVSGAAERMGETLADNASTKVTEFSRTMRSGVIDFLGNEVIPALEELAPIIEGITEAFDALPDWAQKASILTAGGAAIGLKTGALQALVRAISGRVAPGVDGPGGGLTAALSARGSRANPMFVWVINGGGKGTTPIVASGSDGDGKGKKRGRDTTPVAVTDGDNAKKKSDRRTDTGTDRGRHGRYAGVATAATGLAAGAGLSTEIADSLEGFLNEALTHIPGGDPSAGEHSWLANFLTRPAIAASVAASLATDAAGWERMTGEEKQNDLDFTAKWGQGRSESAALGQDALFDWLGVEQGKGPFGLLTNDGALFEHLYGMDVPDLIDLNDRLVAEFGVGFAQMEKVSQLPEGFTSWYRTMRRNLEGTDALRALLDPTSRGVEGLGRALKDVDGTDPRSDIETPGLDRAIDGTSSLIDGFADVPRDVLTQVRVGGVDRALSDAARIQAAFDQAAASIFGAPTAAPTIVDRSGDGGRRRASQPTIDLPLVGDLGRTNRPSSVRLSVGGSEFGAFVDSSAAGAVTASRERYDTDARTRY